MFVEENYSFQDYEFSFQITMLFLFLQWLKRRLLSLLLEYHLGQDKRLLDCADIVCSPLQLAVPKEKSRVRMEDPCGGSWSSAKGKKSQQSSACHDGLREEKN